MWQSKDMGPAGRHVASLNRNVVEHVRSRSFADWVSYINKDWLHRSHRAEKRRQDRGSHGHPQSSRESSLEQDDDSCKATPRIKKTTKCRTHRMKGSRRKWRIDPTGGEKAGRRGGRPSHMRPVSLRNECRTSSRFAWCGVRPRPVTYDKPRHAAKNDCVFGSNCLFTNVFQNFWLPRQQRQPRQQQQRLGVTA